MHRLDHSNDDSGEQTPPSTRRAFLSAAALGGTAIGLGTALGSADQTDRTQIELGGDTPGWVGRAPAEIEGETNPTLPLVPGRDYAVTWENVDGAPHNFAVLDGDEEALVSSEIISEEGATQTVEFTASEEMAAYLCEVHPTTMRGDVSLAEATPTATETATPEESGATETPEGETTEEETPEDGDSDQLSFEQDVVEEQVGDIAALTLSTGGREEVSVTVGGEAVNYRLSFTAVDGNGDGEVTIGLDTFVAGRGSSPEASVVAAASDDAVRDVTLEHNETESPLEPAPYPVQATVDGRIAAEALIALQPRETVAARASVAPQRASLDQPDDFVEAVTPSDRVATGDWMVAEIEASGLYATLDDVDAFRNDDLGYELAIEEADVINRPPRQVPLEEISLVTDPENDRFFVAVDSARLAVDDAYEVTFTITDANPYVPEGEEETVSDEFSVVERTATIDAEEPVSVPPETVTVSGTTTVAPGSVVTLWAAGERGNGFQEADMTTVESDGSWSASIDFSDVDPGTPFTLQVLGLSDDLDGEVTGG